jgi:hypothetical protein
MYGFYYWMLDQAGLRKKISSVRTGNEQTMSLKKEILVLRGERHDDQAGREGQEAGQEAQAQQGDDQKSGCEAHRQEGQRRRHHRAQSHAILCSHWGLY